MWSNGPAGGSSAEHGGEGRSHYLHGERRSRGGGDAPGTHGQERTLPPLERGTVHSSRLKRAP